MKRKLIINPLLVLFSCIVSIGSHSQEIVAGFLSKDSFNCKLKNLREEFGTDKTFPQEVELECLTALSYYPELKNIKIIFRFGSSMATMVSAPKSRSIFKSAPEREYQVTIRKKGTSKNGLEWSELNFSAFVGWIAHELGHIVHYTHKTSAGVLFTGIKYVFPGYRRRMERFTDNLVIQHDLGPALLEGTDYSINRSQAKSKYKRYLGRYYLSCGEIRERINSKDRYRVIYGATKVRRTDASSKS
jgi:hypothetical protein